MVSSRKLNEKFTNKNYVLLVDTVHTIVIGQLKILYYGQGLAGARVGRVFENTSCPLVRVPALP